MLLAGGEVEQLPGPQAGLGLIMFDMPNRFDVYLHDTPDRTIFNRDNRRISHGCIRVQNPLQFAALLMRQPIDTINQGVARGLVTGNTTRNNLPVPVPVFVVYQTAVRRHRRDVAIPPGFLQPRRRDLAKAAARDAAARPRDAGGATPAIAQAPVAGSLTAAQWLAWAISFAARTPLGHRAVKRGLFSASLIGPRRPDNHRD